MTPTGVAVERAREECRDIGWERWQRREDQRVCAGVVVCQHVVESRCCQSPDTHAAGQKQARQEKPAHTSNVIS